jgi:nitrogen fixation-related uncharacterized protein
MSSLVSVFLFFLLLFFLVLFLFLVGLCDFLHAVHIGRFDDIDFHAAELADDRVEVLGIADTLGQMLVEIFKSDVALLLRETDEFADFFLNQLRDIRGQRLNGVRGSGGFAFFVGFGLGS